MEKKIKKKLLLILKKYNKKNKIDFVNKKFFQYEFLDSFNIIKFILEIETNFKIIIKAEEIIKIKSFTIDKLVKFILKKNENR